MMAGPIDWTRLEGRNLKTAMGARFNVVQVTARSVTVRPERSVRDYSLSIPNALDRAVRAYERGDFFPAPADLQHAGLSPILSSYAWALLRAMLIGDTRGGTELRAIQEKDFVGQWRITALEIGEDYVAEGDRPPSITFHQMSYGTLSGEYYFGLSSGELAARVRTFGGEAVLLFDFAGSDEMDPANGAGWAQLVAPNRMEGEFLNDYGRFTAVRRAPRSGKIRVPRRKTRSRD